MSDLATIVAALAAAYPSASPDEIRAVLAGDEVARMRADIVARRDRLRARADQLRAAA